jgi:hypothetical protein
MEGPSGSAMQPLYFVHCFQHKPKQGHECLTPAGPASFDFSPVSQVQAPHSCSFSLQATAACASANSTTPAVPADSRGQLCHRPKQRLTPAASPCRRLPPALLQNRPQRSPWTCHCSGPPQTSCRPECMAWHAGTVKAYRGPKKREMLHVHAHLHAWCGTQAQSRHGGTTKHGMMAQSSTDFMPTCCLHGKT